MCRAFCGTITDHPNTPPTNPKKTHQPHEQPSISFPAFAKAAASQLRDLEGDVEALRQENQSLLEETSGACVCVCVCVCFRCGVCPVMFCAYFSKHPTSMADPIYIYIYTSHTHHRTPP